MLTPDSSVLQKITWLADLRIRGDDPVGMRGGVDRGPGEPLDDAVELEAPVEPVGEARQVGLGVLGADVVARADARGLDVAEGGVHPPERRPARRPLAGAGAGADREVLAARPAFSTAGQQDRPSLTTLL